MFAETETFKSLFKVFRFDKHKASFSLDQRSLQEELKGQGCQHFSQFIMVLK